MLDITGSPHLCVDWDKLMFSMKDRLVSRDDMTSLVNPLLVP